MPLLTQRQSIKRLRAETGMSIEWCTREVKALATVTDGKRKKVLSAYLDRLIENTNHPGDAPRPKGIRPLSAKKIQKLRSYA